jgi:hypothetical protein
MSPRQALGSTLHLFVVLAFFLAGLFFVSLPYLPEVRAQIFEKATVIGLALFITSLVLLLGFYALDRGRYLVIKMGIKTDVNVVRQTVEECIAVHFRKRIFLSDVEMDRKSRIEIRATFASLDENEREALYIEAEKELGILLKERFGYTKPFLLLVKT